MYVITGATGHTGQVVASTLLSEGKPVRVVVRDAQKGEAWKRRGAEVAIAELSDAQALARAFAGADGVYVLIPPSYTSAHLLADQRKVLDAIAGAIEQAKPRHVVLLSSIGAQHATGTGPIVILHEAEERLRKLAPLTAVRAAYFMTNWANVLPLAREQGILPSMLRADRRYAMVSTEDIGRTAARALVAGPGKTGLIELAGPEDYAPADVAETLSGILGKKVQKIDVPEEGIEPALAQAGLNPDLAALFREMYPAMSAGLIAWTGQPVRGRVRLDEALRALLS
jgi:uncharacterized protein YbjT (DUF2867 family)